MNIPKMLQISFNFLRFISNSVFFCLSVKRKAGFICLSYSLTDIRNNSAFTVSVRPMCCNELSHRNWILVRVEIAVIIVTFLELLT